MNHLRIKLFIAAFVLAATGFSQTTLTHKYIGVGDSSNVLSGSSNLQYDAGVLTMGSSTDNYLKFSNSAGTGYLQFDGDGNYAWWTPSSGGIRKMVLTNSGNVGIGTTSPAYKLDVNGSTNISYNFSQWGNYVSSSAVSTNQTLTTNGWSPGNLYSYSAQLPGANHYFLNFYNSGDNFQFLMTSRGQLQWLDNIYEIPISMTGALNISRFIDISPSNWYGSGGMVKVDMSAKHTSYSGYGFEANATFSGAGSENTGIRGFSTALQGRDGPTYGYYANVTINSGGSAIPYSFYGAAGKIFNANDAYLATSSGSVGIGTTSPGSYKLAVNGDAIFTKVKVKAYANWPDYVFHRNYKLKPLKDLETYIKQNNHLPDVPSVKEIQKNGLDLGDNQALLLKKVEELTLYVIDLNKKVEKLSKENQSLKQKIKLMR